jgi:hypothetical protein
MATWNDLRERLRKQYTLDVDANDELALTVERKEAGVTRGQRIMLRRYQAWGREMVEFRSAFGEAGDYDATTLLVDNLNLPLGAIAIHGRFLVLVHRACLDDLAVDGIVFLLTRLSLLADVLESRKGVDRF